MKNKNDDKNDDNNRITNQQEKNNGNDQHETSLNNENQKQRKESDKNIVMKIMFLGLGASSLSIIKIPYNISLIMTPICIFIVGFANNWSYKMILDIYEAKTEKKEEINNYRDILFKKNINVNILDP